MAIPKIVGFPGKVGGDWGLAQIAPVYEIEAIHESSINSISIPVVAPIVNTAGGLLIISIQRYAIDDDRINIIGIFISNSPPTLPQIFPYAALDPIPCV